jgi:hypothetical protein
MRPLLVMAWDRLNYRLNLIPDMRPQLQRAGIPGCRKFSYPMRELTRDA